MKSVRAWSTDSLTEYDFRSATQGVLTGGCGVSAGAEAWPGLLARSLDAPVRSLARPNLSAHALGRVLFLALPSIRPQAVVLVLPPPSYREISVDGNVHHWTPDHGVDAEIDSAMRTFRHEKQQWLDYGAALAFIATVCAANDTPLLLSSWSSLPLSMMPANAVSRVAPFTLTDTPEGHAQFASMVEPWCKTILGSGRA